MAESQDVSVPRLSQILADPASARPAVLEEARTYAAARIEARLDDLERRLAALEARMAARE
ncbi:hypothetical protein [Methylobacterium nonmethylotrophicum]|uniref:Uncharacterized protein n=1 Tax=Methylobacterium nonmethylotrophicum TaxID=1141884 RepID=A0A4Z0NS08_9HYPH|nr:hypothetical protein [Methylobacterium nonmethylotrophicum]TGE00071.1 hypothetical protein EU555_09115 [Methylobacterium nonmethylotrophicum]